jgi:formylglycine-generating enzyme required for sulfatase activity
MTDTNRPLRVFICHSSADKPVVRELCQKLRAEEWIQPWLDEEELYPGEDWDLAIQKAVEESDVVLVCLSNNSITKRGYVQKELRYVVDIALEIPEEEIFIIPLRLEECTPPRSLREWQYADYFEGKRKDAYRRLMVSLKRRAVSLGLRIEAIINKETKLLPETLPPITNEELKSVPNTLSHKQEEKLDEKIAVASDATETIKLVRFPNKIILSNGIEFMPVLIGGMFLSQKIYRMGSDYYDDDEKPRHGVGISYGYWMTRFPITNELFNAYVKAKGIKHPVEGWEKKKDHPVSCVDWINAMAYCQWLNNLLKGELPLRLIVRLPTEAEWEKAARGMRDNHEYPWGDAFIRNNCNSDEGRKNDTTPVGLYSPQGDSPYGCSDMAGNVEEWTHSLKLPYPYKVNDGREDEQSSGIRALRGGSFRSDYNSVRCASRSYRSPDETTNSIGFRVCLAPPLLT